MYNFLIGKTLTEVKQYAAENNLIARVVNIDNVPMMLTCDFNSGRLNLSVENDIVTEIVMG